MNARFGYVTKTLRDSKKDGCRRLRIRIYSHTCRDIIIWPSHFGADGERDSHRTMVQRSVDSFLTNHENPRMLDASVSIIGAKADKGIWSWIVTISL